MSSSDVSRMSSAVYVRLTGNPPNVVNCACRSGGFAMARATSPSVRERRLPLGRFRDETRDLALLPCLDLRFEPRARVARERGTKSLVHVVSPEGNSES